MNGRQRLIISGEIRKYLKKAPIDLIVFGHGTDEFHLEFVTDKLYDEFRDVRNSENTNRPDCYLKIVHPNDIVNLRNVISTANIADGTKISCDVRLKPISSHRYQWYRINVCSNAVDEENFLVFLVLTNINDIRNSTDKQKERSDKNENLLSTILNTTQVPIFWKDNKRRFLGANEAFKRYYGFEKDEDFIGKNDEEMNWHPDPGLFKDDEEEVLNGAATYMVHGKCMQNGEIRDILATKNPIYEGDSIVGLVGSFLDMTESYRQEREINTLNDKLNVSLENERKTNQSINEFLSRMSHEIRTPMNAIMGLAELTMDKTDNEEVKKALKNIKSSCTYLLGIVNDVLAIRKVETGNVSLTFAKVDIHEIIEDVKTIIEPLADQKDIYLNIKENNVTEDTCIADKQRVEQILINILSNAMKFTDYHGYVEFTISQKILKNDIEMTFIIKDNGCGMSQTFLQKIFKPFAQENKDVEKYGEGTGLGLAISKRYANLMKGDITVESIDGFGSTFTVNVRLGRCEGEYADEPVKTIDDIGKSLKGKRILLIEDNSINIDVATGMLNKIGVLVESAKDGIDGCDKFASSAPGYYNAILMDLQMPRRDGYESTKIIRNLKRHDAALIPIVAMSADIFEESKRRAINMGMDSYISKPINSNELYKILSQLT